MSRSFRHTPIIGVVGGRSNKYSKQLANRKLRRRIKQQLHLGNYDNLPLLRQIANRYNFNIDAWCYWPFWEFEKYYNKCMERGGSFSPYKRSLLAEWHVIIGK